jgi:hypothetical protein
MGIHAVARDISERKAAEAENLFEGGTEKSAQLEQGAQSFDQARVGNDQVVRMDHGRPKKFAVDGRWEMQV